MKPGYQLEPVIKKPLSFVSLYLNIASNFQFSKKRKKIKIPKLLIKSISACILFYPFFMFLFPPEAFDESEFPTQMTLFHRSDIFSILTAKV